MNNAPVSMSTLLMPLNSATARNARRQAASAAPSSEAAKLSPARRGSGIIAESLAPGRVISRTRLPMVIQRQDHHSLVYAKTASMPGADYRTKTRTFRRLEKKIRPIGAGSERQFQL